MATDNSTPLFADEPEPSVFADEPVTLPVAPRVSSLEEILADDGVPERVVPFGNRGRFVRVRALTKGQIFTIRQRAKVANGDLDPKRFELLLFLGGVVEPRFSEAHAEALLRRAWGDVDDVLKEILTLSGMLPEQEQAVARSFRA